MEIDVLLAILGAFWLLQNGYLQIYLNATLPGFIEFKTESSDGCLVQLLTACEGLNQGFFSYLILF